MCTVLWWYAWNKIQANCTLTQFDWHNFSILILYEVRSDINWIAVDLVNVNDPLMMMIYKGKRMWLIIHFLCSLSIERCRKKGEGRGEEKREERKVKRRRWRWHVCTESMGLWPHVPLVTAFNYAERASKCWLPIYINVYSLIWEQRKSSWTESISIRPSEFSQRLLGLRIFIFNQPIIARERMNEKVPLININYAHSQILILWILNSN